MLAPTLRRSALLSLMILGLLFVLGTCVEAQDTNPQTHDTVTQFMGGDTLLVGWIDLPSLDIGKAKEFLGQVGAGTLPDVPDRLVELKVVLEQLGATKVYWISSMSNLLSGPQALLIVVPDSEANDTSESKAARLATVLRAFIGDGQSISVEGNVLVAGADQAVQTLLHPVGQPPAALVQTLNQSSGLNGIVMGASTEALRVASTLWLQRTTDQSGLANRISPLLPDLKSAAIHGSIPPSTLTVDIRMEKPQTAEQLATLLNQAADQTLGADAAALHLSTTDSQITLAMTSLAESTAALNSMWKLTQPARSQAQRRTVINQLKHFGLAMHNFHDVHSRFPPQRLVDESGRSLLSWRVMILPYLDQANLYNQFRLDEPWDSEHNRKLISKMPAVYQSPDDSPESSKAGKTRFVAPLTDGSLFGRRGESVRIRDILDGTSNTIMVLHASADHAVTWTQPEDLVVDQDKPIFEQIVGAAEALVGVWCDGAVHVVEPDVSDETLRALLTVDGGEIVEFP